VGNQIELQAAAVEADRGVEVLEVAETAGRLLDLFMPG
jgi:hypothetical protein